MKNSSHILVFVFSLLTSFGYGQKSATPYELSWAKDGPWIGAGVVGTGLGVYLIQQKEGISDERLQEILDKRDKINSLDRWVAGNDSESANMTSDFPFYTSFALPFFLLLDGDMNDHSMQILALYIEGLSTTAAMYAITSGLVDRSRPYVYSEDVELGQRKSSNGQQSFYSGHVGAAATATFLAAKVWTDFKPDMKGKGLVWATAATLPAAIGYFRLEAGRHFFTDVALGYVLGAATGYLVPACHKKKASRLSFYSGKETTFMGDNFQTLAIGLNF